MCIIIDANTLGSVFNSSSANHDEFKPVFDWIWEGKGKIVYGGTKYKEEVSNSKYLGLITEFRRQGKAVLIDDQSVDQEAERVSKLIVHRDFDDQHLVGLLLVSGCILICSLDKRAYPFFTHTMFFNNPKGRPKIYSGRRNNKLLNDKYITSVCKPCSKTTKEQKDRIGINPT
jgi:hypothetical protein